MSVEDRLREGLRRNAASFEPAPDASLERVTARRRHRAHRRVALAAVAAAAAVIGAVVVLEQRGSELTVTSSAETSVPGSASAPALTGRFEATVGPGSASGLRFEVAGRWVLELTADGRVLATPPGSYVGVVSGALFQATDEWFRTSLFESDLCSGVPAGVYRWVRTASGVRFTAEDDDCAGRVAVLAATDWTPLG